MATTLISLTDRLRAALMDTGALIWDAAALAESIRLALGEYSLAAQSPAALAGLDGAAATTLDPLHDSLVVWGAAAYAALSRAVDRAESYQAGPGAADLRAWGDRRLGEFKAMLGALFPAYQAVLHPNPGAEDGSARLADLHAAIAAPWASWDADPSSPIP